MRKIIFFILIACAFSVHGIFGQGTENIIPWFAIPEYNYHILPVGGWNILGSYSPRSSAMGETFLASLNPSSGILNPALLSLLSHAQFSLSYRYTENVFQNLPEIIPLDRTYFPSGNLSFRRKTDYLDNLGLSLPLGKWTLAANYFLFQEYNFPDINNLYSGFLARVEQQGEAKGANIAISHNLSSSFSVGASLSYIYGSLSRFQVPIYYWFIDENGVISNDIISIFIPPYPIPDYSEEFELDIKGFFLNIGFIFKVGDKWILGFALRPPFKLNFEARITYNYPYYYSEGVTVLQENFFFKYPLTAVVSMLYNPLPGFTLTADISYWGWSNATTDYSPGWIYSVNFRDIFRLNLGAEWRLDLSLEDIKELFLRAGFIYDPQPYQYPESFARSFFCSGICLRVKNFFLEAAAKISVFQIEHNTFKSNLIQAGIRYLF